MAKKLEEQNVKNEVAVESNTNEIVEYDTYEKDDKSGKLPYKLSKWRLFTSALGLYFLIRKAKKISKRIKTDPNSYSEEYRYNWFKKKISKVLRIPNIEMHVWGIENWLDKGVVLAPNHQSNLDPLMLIVINDFQKQQPISFVAKIETWSTKSIKHFMNLIDNVPLDRKNPRSALNAMKEAKELINEYKRSVVIFPEGTRSQGPEMNEFHGASMKVAQMAYAPIIPVSIVDSYKVYQKRKGIMPVKIVFGKPMMPNKFIATKTSVLTETVKREIQKNIDKYKDVDLKSKNLVVKKYDKKNKIYYY
ncbi:lysophospholipid acyltransferase family protein [Spiroplasma tabanidicola]|uniref:1-acyl-sn-glycerol-3-phosphate acyltransferase n=1 Tax=Spiroplasma tabanidicola TaxID=324079 RepID=A0A6I6CB09_9MOLU|nr:lysophospholipid acyltransferase family protein [Spiroplasma tabanidicola]QGS52125.1 1-acyl-sn-glycerol-3-phosphate acyltransferase [Spiroplasma tabanidicola]